MSAKHNKRTREQILTHRAELNMVLHSMVTSQNEILKKIVEFKKNNKIVHVIRGSDLLFNLLKRV